MKFDPRNVIYSCMAHNAKMESGEGWAWSWYIKEFGQEQCDTIHNESHGAARWGIKELLEMDGHWRQLGTEV